MKFETYPDREFLMLGLAKAQFGMGEGDGLR